MRFILGLIVFWTTIFGIKLLLENKKVVEEKFSLLFSFTLIGLLEFLFGILNIMKIGSLLIILITFIYIAMLLLKKELKIKKVIQDLKNPINLICLLVFIYITLLGLNMHLTHYDNFSHWGLIVKSIFINNSLPNFENDYILFKGYQPGSACFIYFFGLLSGKNEANMIIAQNYLFFSYYTVLFGFVEKNNRIIKVLLLIAFYIFFMTASFIGFNNLLVDSLVAIMFVASIIIVYEYRNNIKKAITLSLPIMMYMLTIKNVGLVLSGIICLYILYIAISKKELNTGIKGIILVGISLLTILILWQSHVSMVYGYLALNSKHSLSIQNIIHSINSLGQENLLLFIKIYLKHLINLSNNVPNIYMLIINGIIILFGLITKEKNKILKFLLAMNFLYLGYYIILGCMYIFSMPWEEAKTLAGYNRYMMTIIDAIMGLLVFFIIKNKEKNKLIKHLIIIITVVLLIPIKYNEKTFLTLLGKDGYKHSEVERFDEIINQIPLDKSNYYIYSPSSKGDYGKLEHMAIYKLLKKNCIIINDKEDLSDVEEDSYLILFDKLNNYDEILNNNFEYINEVTLIKKKNID